MNSGIHLCQSPLPFAPGPLSLASRVHVSLSHGSVSVSQCSKRNQLVVCMRERLSEGSKMSEENGKKNIVRGIGGASLAVACVLGAFTLSFKMNPKPNVAYAFDLWPPQVSPTQAGASVFDTLRRLISSRGSTRKGYFDREPNYDEIEALKLYAMALTKGEGREAANEAETILRDECKKWEGSQASDKLTMTLIELLLYQKKYPEASRQLDKLMDEVGIDTGTIKVEDDDFMRPLDVPREEIYLLKAIVDSIFDKREAAIWWKKYRTAMDPYPSPSRFPSPSRRY